MNNIGIVSTKIPFPLSMIFILGSHFWLLRGHYCEGRYYKVGLSFSLGYSFNVYLLIVIKPIILCRFRTNNYTNYYLIV